MRNRNPGPRIQTRQCVCCPASPGLKSSAQTCFTPRARASSVAVSHACSARMMSGAAAGLYSAIAAAVKRACSGLRPSSRLQPWGNETGGAAVDARVQQCNLPPAHSLGTQDSESVAGRCVLYCVLRTPYSYHTVAKPIQWVFWWRGCRSNPSSTVADTLHTPEGVAAFHEARVEVHSLQTGIQTQHVCEVVVGAKGEV